MPSHFASIGMHVETDEEYDALEERIINDTEAFDVPNGRYLRWSSQCGAELWIHLDGESDIIGVTPYSAGRSRVRIGITSREPSPAGSSLDGVFRGWANALEGTDPEVTGDSTPVFNAPDFCRYSDLKLRSVATAQIAAFAHEITLFDSLESFDAAQTRVASQSFFPWDVDTKNDETCHFLPYATFAGHILEAELKVNELTDQPFYWILVDAYGGSFDVVFEPELINTSPQLPLAYFPSTKRVEHHLVSTSPKVGGVLLGSFWLSGRLTRYTKA